MIYPMILKKRKILQILRGFYYKHGQGLILMNLDELYLILILPTSQKFLFVSNVFDIFPIILWATALCYVNVAGAMWRITGHNIHVWKVIKQKVIAKPYVKLWQNNKVATSFVCNLIGPKVTVLATGVNCWVTLSRRCNYRLSCQFSSTDILKMRVCRPFSI